MIYTLTLNPSVDYIVSVPDIRVGQVNRSESRRYVAGGKGINVSAALSRIAANRGKNGEMSAFSGHAAICLCGGGFAGKEFARQTQLQDFESIMLPVTGCDTRINVKIEHGNTVTEINGDFTADEEAIIGVSTILAGLNSGDFLVMGGSLPNGFPTEYYAAMTELISEKGVSVIVDTSGEPLKEVVRSGKAFLIKPNRHELGELFGVSIDSPEKAVEYARKAGCPTLVSLGEQGAVLVAGDVEIVRKPPKVVSGYTVGAGDALLAGFVSEWTRSRDYEKSLIAGMDFAVNYIEG
ncbi:MAG: 1-phosphofructokinase family hexose kinase [Oscillospiraceae bacterium]|nr:1-phosphofructokinase family hexose kinase [Oscillospiraceae bacterium]